MQSTAILVCGEQIASYGFPGGHPFGPDRHDVFMREIERSECWARLARRAARPATRQELELFHTPDYLQRVEAASRSAEGFLDAGDTPAFAGVYEAAANVVGGTLEALAAIIEGPLRRAFIPIAGLHHAGREHAAGFCVFTIAAWRSRPPGEFTVCSAWRTSTSMRITAMECSTPSRTIRRSPSRTCTRTADFFIQGPAIAPRPAAAPPSVAS